MTNINELQAVLDEHFGRIETHARMTRPMLQAGIDPQVVTRKDLEDADAIGLLLRLLSVPSYDGASGRKLEPGELLASVQSGKFVWNEEIPE